MIKKLLQSVWLEHLQQYKKIWIGFSGGLDSSVLLHELAHTDLFVGKVVAVHVNHGLSPHANDWQRHCEEVCVKLGVPFINHVIKIPTYSNLEEQARLARYGIFESIIESTDCFLLAHHRHDQAETILLHLFRGTGIDGLAAMPAIRQLGAGRLIRPLLDFTRTELESYAVTHRVSFIEDESNLNLAYSRNYIRHRVLPMLQEKWPNVVRNISSCANHCQEAKENLDQLAYIDCSELRRDSLLNPMVSLSNMENKKIVSDLQAKLCIDSLPRENQSRMINVLRVWLKNHKIRLPNTDILRRLVNEVILARPDAMPLVSWNNIIVRRYQNNLFLLTEKPINAGTNTIWKDFPSICHLANGVDLHAIVTDDGFGISADSRIEVRFRRGGECFKSNGQTKSLKKLFQQWQVPPWQRNQVPLIYVNDTLKIVVGYGMTDQDEELNKNLRKYCIISLKQR